MQAPPNPIFRHPIKWNLTVRRDWLPYAAFAFCSLIWGSTFLVISFSNDALPPFWALCLRLLLAALILFTVMAFTKTPIPRGNGLGAAAIYGALNLFGSLSLLYWGETHLPSGLAAVLYATAPVFSMLLARVAGLETLDAKRLIAAGVAVGGVAIIFWRQLLLGQPPLPILAVLASVVVAVTGSINLKKSPKQSAIATNAIGAAVAAPLCFVESILLKEKLVVPSTPSQYLPLIYLTLAGLIGAFVTMTWLLGRWRASSTSFIAVVIPVIAVILGAVFRNEMFAPESLAGAAVVICATAFIVRSESAAH